MFVKSCILLFSSLALLYLGGMVFAYFFADQIIFPKVSSSYETLPGLTKLRTEAGTQIASIYLKSEASPKLLIYSHGNGEDLGRIWPILQMYQNRGISVLAYDYPGYGISEGIASEKSVLDAADRIYRYATEDLGYTPEHITLYGRSLGSGPSTWLATKYPVSGIILEGAFSSTFRVMTKIKLLPFDAFDNLIRLNDSPCPVLILHGGQDRTVPFNHGQAILKAVGPRGQHLWLPDAGHNDIIEVAGPLYWETVLPFISEPTSSSTL